MPRQKLDPKHVRWFFYRKSLFVQITTLLIDGAWWLVVKACSRPIRTLKELFQNLRPSQLHLVNSSLRQHSLIIGRTGTGKSTLFHHLIRNFLTRNTKPTLVFFDPHGDLADLISRDKIWRQSNRLVYIRFDQIADRSIHFNPFEITDYSEENINRSVLQFSSAVERIVGETFTPRQRTLVRSCISVMLHRPGSTLADLVRILQDGQNADLVCYGQQELPNPIDRQFFMGSFHDPQYRLSKLALISRLTDIVRDPTVRRVTGQSNSFDLGKLLDSGKVIVIRFDPSIQGRDTIRTIGQLFSAAILSHVMGRPPKNRHPIYMLVVECQYFVSPTITEILGETRKFGLYLALATQRLGALDRDLQDAIVSNVGNFWIGGSRHNTAERLARETGIPAEKLRDMPNLKFLHVAAGKEPVYRRLRYLGTRFCMPRSEWKKLLIAQIERYYGRVTNPSSKPNNPSSKSNSWELEFL